MINRKLGLMTFAVLLSLAACQPQASPGPDQEPVPVRSAGQVTAFKLKIVFRGLIGFSQDSGKVRAFLVHAQYDPATVGPDDLPPGVYHELGGDMNPRPADWLDRLNRTVPPHFSSISFSNARVSGCSTCDSDHDQRRSILGADLHLKSDQQGVGCINLTRLASVRSIIAARRELTVGLADLASLDQLDATLAAPQPAVAAPIDRRLAARVEVEVGTGDEVSANLVPDRSGNIARYSFNLPSELIGCRGTIENGQRLAEEVVVTQQRTTGPVTLIFGPNDRITVEPIDATRDVVVNITNQPHTMAMAHPQAHRWYYRLLKSTGQNLVEKHFFACRRGNFGPPDCPQMQFFVAQ
ncbi:MAG TPA: hypothetical protein VGX68_07015 [Thermoanaerobaculia bacterium]|jgi:hypothetical protein|nr:hypothetical protein [Thermoanaerobaculia bacterium]